MPNTPTKTFRCDADLWDQAMAKAKEQGKSLTDVLVRALADFVKDEDEGRES